MKLSALKWLGADEQFVDAEAVTSIIYNSGKRLRSVGQRLP